MIRIFIGTSPNGEDAEASAVLEYTLRRHASEELDITWMRISRDRKSPWNGWNTANFSTPFTPFRWTIPEICNFEGKAIYMDTDIFVLGDIAELWNQSTNGKAILVQDMHKMPYRTCVALMDCAVMRQVVPSISSLKRKDDAHEMIMNYLMIRKDFVGQFSGKWNVVDLKNASLFDPEVKAVHYSSIAHQPHLPLAVERLKERNLKHWYDGERFDHWRTELTEEFKILLAEAKDAGFTPDKYEPRSKPIEFRMRSYKNVRVKGFSREVV